MKGELDLFFQDGLNVFDLLLGNRCAFALISDEAYNAGRA